MKKFFSVCVAALAAITMTAQDIAVNIKLTAQSGGESTLLLASGTGVSSADNATLVAPLTNSDNVAIYVQDDERYSIFATDGAFANQPLAIVTDRMGADKQNYTLHFEDVLAGTGSGAFKLKDLVTGDEFTIVNGGTYNFVVNTTNAANYVAGTNTVIGNRFIINYDVTAIVTSLTTNAYGWATFSFDTQDLELLMPAGLKIYTGEYNGADALNLTQVDYVEANEGVVVYGMPNTTYYFAAGTGLSVYGANNLKPTSAFDPSNYSNVFVLKGDALLEYVGTGPLAANKAYLQLPTSAPAPRRINFVFSATEGVENVEAVEAPVKFVENGQIFIRRGNEVYNLQGQMVK